VFGSFKETRYIKNIAWGICNSNYFLNYHWIKEMRFNKRKFSAKRDIEAEIYSNISFSILMQEETNWIHSKLKIDEIQVILRGANALHRKKFLLKFFSACTKPSFSDP
jgi:hypothetical protein